MRAEVNAIPESDDLPPGGLGSSSVTVQTPASLDWEASGKFWIVGFLPQALPAWLDLFTVIQIQWCPPVMYYRLWVECGNRLILVTKQLVWALDRWVWPGARLWVE